MSTKYCVLDRWKFFSDLDFCLKTVHLRCCSIGVALIAKKLVVFQGHCYVQCFLNTEYSNKNKSKSLLMFNMLYISGIHMQTILTALQFYWHLNGETSIQYSAFKGLVNTELRSTTHHGIVCLRTPSFLHYEHCS